MAMSVDFVTKTIIWNRSLMKFDRFLFFRVFSFLVTKTLRRHSSGYIHFISPTKIVLYLVLTNVAWRQRLAVFSTVKSFYTTRFFYHTISDFFFSMHSQNDLLIRCFLRRYLKSESQFEAADGPQRLFSFNILFLPAQSF